MQPMNDPNASNWGAAPAHPQMMAGQPVAFPIGQQPMMGMGYHQATSAVTALVLAIVGVIICPLTLIIGLIMANQALAITSVSPGHPDHGMAKAAQIVSWCGIALWAVVILFYAIIIVFFVTSGYCWLAVISGRCEI